MQLLLYKFFGSTIAAIIGVLYLKKMPLSYKLVTLQVIVALVCGLYGYYLGAVLHQHNIWLFNYYWIIGEVGLMGLSGILLLKKVPLRVISVSLLLLSAGVWAYNVIINSIHHYEPLVNTSIHISLVLIFSIVLFDSLLFGTRKLASQPDFWLCLSVLLYFGCNIPLYGLYNYLLEHDPATLKKLFQISLALNFIRYPLVAVSFYLMGRQHKKPALG